MSFVFFSGKANPARPRRNLPRPLSGLSRPDEGLSPPHELFVTNCQPMSIPCSNWQKRFAIHPRGPVLLIHPGRQSIRIHGFPAVGTAPYKTHFGYPEPLLYPTALPKISARSAMRYEPHKHWGFVERIIAA